MQGSVNNKKQDQQIMIKFLQFLYNNENINYETMKKVKEEIKKEV